MTIAFTDNAEVRGGIAETGAKMSGSLNSDRLFGVVDNETEPCVDKEVAPFCL